MDQLVPCRRLLLQSCSRSTTTITTTTTTNTNNTGLTDSILLEILIRLPCAKSANRFKSVSKAWNSLISHPYFISRFIQHRRLPSQCALLLFQYYDIDEQQQQQKMMIDREKIYIITTQLQQQQQQQQQLEVLVNSRGFSLSFLPCYNPLDPVRPIRVVGSSSDLLLCCSNSSLHPNNIHYFICNLLTMHWVELPPAPHHPLKNNFRIGFFCDPTTTTTTTTIVNYNRYAVLRIPKFPRGSTQFKVEIFSSDTRGGWLESYVPCPPNFHHSSNTRDSVFCNRIFYWASPRGILTIDLFRRATPSRDNGAPVVGFIPLPAEFKSSHPWWNTCLGVCQGRLRLSQVVSPFPVFHSSTLTVWELNDAPLLYSSAAIGEREWWRLQHKSLLFEVNSELTKLAQSQSEIAGPLAFDPVLMAFHPQNCDVVYLYVYGGIVLYNIRSKTLKMGSRTPPGVCRGDMYPESVFPLELPSWPTPIPTLPQNALF